MNDNQDLNSSKQTVLSQTLVLIQDPDVELVDDQDCIHSEINNLYGN